MHIVRLDHFKSHGYIPALYICLFALKLLIYHLIIICPFIYNLTYTRITYLNKS